MLDCWRNWAPIPLRLVVGAFLVSFGYPMLFSSAGHANIVHYLEAFGVPLAPLIGWAVGLVQFGGGLLLFFGVFARLGAALGIFSVGGHALLALLRGGFPEPLPGQQPLPGYELSLFLIAGMAAVLIGGAGSLSYDWTRARRRYLRQKPLTLMAKIRQGAEAALREVLAEINSDLQGNPYVRFGEDRISHFVRWTIFKDPEFGARLVFASNYNGDLEEYVDELVRVTPGLDDIWGHCEGYEGSDRFHDFVRRHAQKNRDLYFGYPYETVESIRRKIAVRKTIEGLLDLPQVARLLDEHGVRSFLDLLAKIAPPVPLWKRAVRALQAIWKRIFDYLWGVYREVGKRLAQFYGSIGMNYDFSKVMATCGDAEGRRRYIERLNRAEATDGAFIQNQLTVYAKIRSGRLLRLRFALLFGAPLIKTAWPPGNFAEVFTLHSFRWLVIDGGKHLVFMSNFDFSAENYLGDFLAKLVWGLDTFYNNCEGYPAGGMRQVEPFVEWIRENQVTPEVYYSAYPEETILNLSRDRAISDAMTKNFDREAVEDWLNQF